jgi:hypothetical protein
MDPISLLTGSLILNYECRVTETHAFAVEGAYTFPLLGNTLWMGDAQLLQKTGAEFIVR